MTTLNELANAIRDYRGALARVNILQEPPFEVKQAGTYRDVGVNEALNLLWAEQCAEDLLEILAKLDEEGWVDVGS